MHFPCSNATAEGRNPDKPLPSDLQMARGAPVLGTFKMCAIEFSWKKCVVVLRREPGAPTWCRRGQGVPDVVRLAIDPARAGAKTIHQLIG